LTEPQYPFALPIGTQISGYEIVRVLGVGGFGITYEGFNPVTRRRAAIKEFFPRGIASRENATQVVFSRQDSDVVTWALERFRRSTTELCDFRHPNIVEVLNYVPANETGYMFMEQVEGETLETWLRKKNGPPTMNEMRIILEPVCDALEYVHAKKFIHRDIAPDNIMIRQDGRPMLIDFGAIKIIAQTAQTRAASGRSYGVAKQHYSPPEQMDEDAELDSRADVYALGAVLYRAVTGQPPVDADKRKNDLILKGADSYVSVAQASRIPLSEGVINIIDRSLALKPSDRPSSISEFRAGMHDEVIATAVIAPAATTIVEPMPTPGFSGPGIRPVMPEEDLPVHGHSATNYLHAEPVHEPVRSEPPAHAVSAPPMPDKPMRSGRSWLGIAAIASVVLIVFGIGVASISSFSTRTTTTTTTTNNNQSTQNNQQQTGDVHQLIARADRLGRENNQQGAIDAYTQALRVVGTDTNLRLLILKGRAARYGVLSKYVEQIADLSDVIRLENNAANYSARGLAYWFAGEYDRAIADQTRAIQLDPKNASYVGERGRTNIWKKDYIAAVADFSDAIRLNPESGYYYGQRGSAHFSRLDYSRALSDYDQAIRLSPNDLTYYRTRADVAVARADATPSTRSADLNRAKADMDVVISRGTAVGAADYEKRGLILERLGNRSDAIADFRAALARDANSNASKQALQRLGG
jgi:serine/threonine protein kinase/regulator of sirC expression with transglutaminase-like and TPR domain